MMTPFTIRNATEVDIPWMLKAYFSAFAESPFSQRCFPSWSQDVRDFTANKLRSQIGAEGNFIIVAESEGGSILGWARWVRRPAADAPLQGVTLSEADYPSIGDAAFAVRFFQANADATFKHTAGQSCWFLSTIATEKDAQGQGVGTQLMRFGVDMADKEGWCAYVNSSPEGKRLYEKFGFSVVDESEFEELNIVQYHMKRLVKRVD